MVKRIYRGDDYYDGLIKREEEKINKLKHKIDNGKIKETINTKEIMSKFDLEVFEALVEYVIIGGYVDGQKDSCMIRFICKSGLNDTTCDELTQEDIIDNQNINNGSSQGFIPVLDFYSNQTYYVFERNEFGKLQKNMKNKIRVRLELSK